MRHIVIICICLCVFACVSNDYALEQESVGHVVLIWLNEPGNQQHLERVIEVTQQLKVIPEIKLLHVGTSIPSDRKIVDDSFDVGIYMTFSNVDDMERYLTHPKHVDAVKTTLKPLASKILVYDLSTNLNK